MSGQLETNAIWNLIDRAERGEAAAQEIGVLRRCVSVIVARAEAAEASVQPLVAERDRLAAGERRVRAEVARIDRFAEITASAPDRSLYRAIAAALREALDGPAESAVPACGWSPIDATTGCDWDRNCPVHGEAAPTE